MVVNDCKMFSAPFETFAFSNRKLTFYGRRRFGELGRHVGGRLGRLARDDLYVSFIGCC